MAGLVTVPSNLPVEAVATQPSDMDALLFDTIGEAVLKVHSDSLLIYEFSNGDQIRFRGEFDYNAPGILSGGSLFQIMQYKNGALQFDINQLDVSAVAVLDEIRNGRTAEVFEALLSGGNKVTGSHGDDLLRSHGGADTIRAGAGDDVVLAGDGDDEIDVGLGQSLVFGETGNDTVFGGETIDFLRGDEGADLLFGRTGSDVLRGGPGGDTLNGEAGLDFLGGADGADSLSGAGDADTLSGGGGDDFLDGGDGDDWLTGDAGADVLVGGTGADIYHFYIGAQTDRVLGFNPGEGDRIELAPGTTYRLLQIGNDAVLRVGPTETDQLVLVGADASTVGQFVTGGTAIHPVAPKGVIAAAGSSIAVDMDALNIGAIGSGTTIQADPTLYISDYGGGSRDELRGTFIYNSMGDPVGGTLEHITAYRGGELLFDAGGLNFAAVTFLNWVADGETQTALMHILGGHDDFTGSAFSDVLRSFGGDDTILGGGGGDTLDGGDGGDFLRGQDGSDSISGGLGFDNINGNLGVDTLSGGAGTDWVLGGQGADLLYGDDGDDLVSGNIGDDVVDGGDGADALAGGQGNDILRGGAGGDFLSGDLGADTLVGGAGADTFIFAASAGSDQINDFNGLEGDRILLRGGSFTVGQAGVDTLITFSGGGQVVVRGTNGGFDAAWIGVQ